MCVYFGYLVDEPCVRYLDARELELRGEERKHDQSGEFLHGVCKLSMQMQETILNTAQNTLEQHSTYWTCPGNVSLTFPDPAQLHALILL